MSLSIYQASHPSHLDDEILALTVQVDEINLREETKKAKYSPEHVPDLEVAYANYLAEMEAHLAFLKDIKLAHSIANAVDADAQAIAEIEESEARAHEDHRTAVKMSNDDPELEAPPPYNEEVRENFIDDEVMRRLATLLTSSPTSSKNPYEESQAEAGPSVPYAQRQAKALGILAGQTFQCTACSDEFRLAHITQLQCKDQYCGPCLKRFIMQGVMDHDLALLPPRCCGEPVPSHLITSNLTADELADFQNAEIEKATRDKTYCSNSECGRFIAPCHIIAGEATCPRCDARTCAMCKNPHHEEDCPADPDLQATLDIGQQNGWRRCFSCRSLVAIEWGCNHMTCRCGAEFCYQCGTEWGNPRQCNCALWSEANLLRHAEERVDRDAPADLPIFERQRRLAEVQAQFRDVDECDHRGRKMFTGIQGGGRAGFRCEWCFTRHWKFILECRGCELRLCMDCRRYRV